MFYVVASHEITFVGRGLILILRRMVEIRDTVLKSVAWDEGVCPGLEAKDLNALKQLELHSAERRGDVLYMDGVGITAACSDNNLLARC